MMKTSKKNKADVMSANQQQQQQGSRVYVATATRRLALLLLYIEIDDQLSSLDSSKS